jgi:hypothetical protein
MEDIQNQVEGSRLLWFVHVQGMDEHEIPIRVLGMKMSGKKRRCRPQTWWLDQVKKDMEVDSHGGRYRKCRNGEIETAGDSLSKVNPREWK